MPQRDYQAFEGRGRGRPHYRGRDDRDDDRPRDFGADPEYDEGRPGRDEGRRDGLYERESRAHRMDDMGGPRGEELPYARERRDDDDDMPQASRQKQQRDHRSMGPSSGTMPMSTADGPHRGKGPRGYARGDDRIREDVCNRLTDDTHLDASDIEVEVKDGEVTLTGTVRERMDKRRAEDVADAASGVKHVQNNLRIKPALVMTGDDDSSEKQAGAAQSRSAKR